MTVTCKRSRRLVLAGLASAPTLLIATARAEQNSAPNLEQPRTPNDLHLVRLGCQFEFVTAQIDHAIETGSHLALRTLEELSQTESQIIATPATTIDGLRVKARAACWALLGDLAPDDQSTTDKRMALSIVRDLIRLYDPGLERAGALQELVEDVEKEFSASKRPDER